jgi:hypothetical protein
MRFVGKFFEHFVAALVGKDIFRKWCFIQEPSKYMTKLDEAMAMLIIANNCDVCSEMAEIIEAGARKVKVEDCKSTNKYCKEGRGRGHYWSVQGKHYYSDMFNKIEEDRTLRGEAFDAYFFTKMKEEDSARMHSYQKLGLDRTTIGKYPSFLTATTYILHIG